MTGILWTVAGLAVAFGFGWGVGFTRGVKQSAEQLGKLGVEIKALDLKAESLTAALLASRRAPITSDDAIVILREELDDQVAGAG